MKSKQLCNKTIILEDLKRFFGISILYLLFLFVSGPLFLFGKFNNIHRLHELIDIVRFIQVRENPIVLLALAAGVLTGTLLFRYIHKSNSVSVIHGYPIKRSELLNSHIISGIVLISIPIIINAIILTVTLPKLVSNINSDLLLQSNINIENIINALSTKQIVGWSLKMEIITLVSFLISVFSAMISGITLIQVFLAFIFPFVPLFIIMMIYGGLEFFVFGFGVLSNRWQIFANNISPITVIFNKGVWSLGYNIWYVTFCILLYIVCLFLYKRRDLEKVNDTIVFDVLKPIFKYGVTLCTMFITGGYFYSIKENTNWLWIGCFLGSFLGYFIAQMIIDKKIKVFNKYKGYIVYVLVIVAIVTGLEVDIFGYESNIPKVKNVEEVYYGYINYNDSNENGISEKENIQSVINIHKIIINNKEMIESSEDKSIIKKDYIQIGYKCKNGKKIYRKYVVPASLFHNKKDIKSLYESEEYKRITYKNVFNINMDEIDVVRIGNDYFGKVKEITDKTQMNEILEELRKDILDESYESMIRNAVWATIRFNRYENNHYNTSYYMTEYFGETIQKEVHIQFKKSYKNLEKYFKNEGYMHAIRVMPEDLKYIVLRKASSKDYNHRTASYDSSGLEDLQAGKDTKVIITEKQKIEKILRRYTNTWTKGNEYIVEIYDKNGRKSKGWYDEHEALKLLK